MISQSTQSFIYRYKEKKLCILLFWLSERQTIFFFFNFPVNLLNNPNLDDSETVFVRASFSNIRGTAAGEKKTKLLKP